MQYSIVEEISNSTGIKPRDVRRVLDALNAEIADKLREDERVKIDGLGIFSVSAVKDIPVKNKYIDKPIRVSFNRIYFTADKSLKKQINE